MLIRPRCSQSIRMWPGDGQPWPFCCVLDFGQVTKTEENSTLPCPTLMTQCVATFKRATIFAYDDHLGYRMSIGGIMDDGTCT
mmetsp:Transcript_16969/g.37270  ORF Transcript_16969/g.37270 Transcript_16969/m.37270 type:complete len:83 (+) Transcript_16969:726-974(+)